MAKMKVFELAKELEVQSKEIIAFLQGKGYEVKVAQSSIEDEAIGAARKQFGKGRVENAGKTETAPGVKNEDKGKTMDKAESTAKAENVVKA